MSALGQMRMNINVSDKSYSVHWQGSSSAFCSTFSSTQSGQHTVHVPLSDY